MKVSLISMMILTGLSVTAASAQTSASGPQLTTDPVYQKNCAKCHGKAAEGRHFGGPSLVSGKSTVLSEEELRTIVTNGKGRMPKYAGKLTPQEINTLVRQIKDARKK